MLRRLAATGISAALQNHSSGSIPSLRENQSPTLLIAVPNTTYAGVFIDIREFVIGTLNISNGAIVHPPGYHDTSPVVEVGICVNPGPPTPPVTLSNDLLIGQLQQAIAMWNSLTPSTENCGGVNDCAVAEDLSQDSTSPTPGRTQLLLDMNHRSTTSLRAQ